jgi:hypothetical protein
MCEILMLQRDENINRNIILWDDKNRVEQDETENLLVWSNLIELVKSFSTK